MSALGHKQTCAAQNGMSAFTPIATAKADIKFPTCASIKPRVCQGVADPRTVNGQTPFLLTFN